MVLPNTGHFPNSLDVDNLGTGQDLDPLLGRDVVGNGGSVLVGVHQQEVQLRFQQYWTRKSAIYLLFGVLVEFDS